MSEADESNLELFVEESRKRLGAIHADLRGPNTIDPETDPVPLDRMLRTVRGIRGSATFLDLSQIFLLSQLLEVLLSRLQDQTLSLGEESLSCLSAGLQKLDELLADVSLPRNIDPEVETIQALLDTPPPGRHFDLSRYPRAMAEAAHQGLFLYAIDIRLRGDPSAKKQQFDVVKDSLLVIGNLIDSLPDLPDNFELGNSFQGKQVLLLVSTVLQKDLLIGLTQLPDEQIKQLSIPAEAVAPPIEETAGVPLDAPPHPPRVPEASEPPAPDLSQILPETIVTHRSEEDILAETELGRIEELRRQSYFAERERQRLAREEQAREAERKALLREKHKRYLLRSGGVVAAAGVLASIWLFVPPSPEKRPAPPVTAAVAPVTAAVAPVTAAVAPVTSEPPAVPTPAIRELPAPPVTPAAVAQLPPPPPRPPPPADGPPHGAPPPPAR
ncbi:MAG: Hpt domain-containing protein, partial [Magnetococcales bacterium]|nr:Hpt domain-containing protein [Magnetococcales bacterium]